MKTRSIRIAGKTNQVPRMAVATAMGIEALEAMKTRIVIPKLMLLLCMMITTTAVFGQTVVTWTNAAGGLITDVNNWEPNALPNGNDGSGFQQTAQFDGRTPSDLTITNTTAVLPNTGFGTIGIILALTANQTDNVQFISTVAGGSSGQIGMFSVSNSSHNASIILGDFNTPTSLFRLTGRPAGATHYYWNDSTGPSIINPSVEWQAGGGTAYTFEFGGTGDWIVRSSLRNDNGSGGTSVTVDGPGALIWTNGTRHVAQDPLNLVTINGGKLVIQGPGLFPPQAANSTIALNAPLIFDAAAQSDSITRIISGTAQLIVTNGTLALSGQSTYTGNTVLSGGELIAAGAEDTNSTFGPLGVGGTISFSGGSLGFSVNNVFDYSGRFNTNAGQAYSIDTAGQNVMFTNAAGLSSSGGTLTKLGSGTLTLAGPSTYSGLTTVSAGKLVLQGPKSGSGNITVADGGFLGVVAGGAQITPGTLSMGTSSSGTLEFENVSSTTTAPIAAGTVSAAGTVTINVNSGALTPGQSYPLLSWTSGSGPAVSLGILNGFIGNLATNGNTIQLNVTATAYTWTGGTSGNWDTNTVNNWLQNGSAVVFANGGPVLFDDTSSRTNVTVSGLIEPTSVTVNNSTKTYSIASSGGNNIGGSASLTKGGSGLLTLSGGANTYTGVTTVSGGSLSVGALANGGSASDIGSANSSAANLVLNGGALLYTGGTASIDRLFTIGVAGGTIDSSGSGALAFNGTGPLGYIGNATRSFILTGTQSDDNTLAANIADNGGATTLTKNGAGKWVLTGTNTYSGATTIANGVLQVGTGGGSGSLGSGGIVNNARLRFNRTGILTVSGAISGSGAVTNDGTGTVILAGNNSYLGDTTINAGTLQVGNGGGTGALDVNAAITNYGTLVFNSTAALTLNGVISGSGQLIKQGSGLLKLLGNNTYTGATTVASGGVLQIASGNQGTFASPIITNNGRLLFVRQDNGILIYGGNIIGTGSVTKEANNDNFGDVTLTGTNTYTGSTFIRAGAIILGDGATPGAGSIVGNVVFTNSSISDVAAKTLTFNYPDDRTFSGNIIGGVNNVGGGTGQVAPANAGSVVHQGSGTLTLTGTNTYPAGTTINQGTLQVGAGGTNGSVGTGTINDNGTLVFNRSDSLTFGGVITGGGSLIQQGTGTTTLTATNTYLGSTTISNGTLIINGDNSAASTFVYAGTLGGTGALSGPVTMEAGTTLAPGASVGTLTINSDLSIGGNLSVEVNKSLTPSSDLVVVSGVLTNTGTGTLTVTNLGSALAVGDKFTLFSRPLLNGSALTITGGNATWTNNLAVDGSITVTAVTSVTPPTLTFSHSGSGGLQFSWTGSFKLQSQTNSISRNNWADYPAGGTSPVTVPIDVTKGSVLFRLVSAP
jgi:autotransporter-associated beta strand protein